MSKNNKLHETLQSLNHGVDSIYEAFQFSKGYSHKLLGKIIEAIPSCYSTQPGYAFSNLDKLLSIAVALDINGDYLEICDFPACKIVSILFSRNFPEDLYEYYEEFADSKSIKVYHRTNDWIRVFEIYESSVADRTNDEHAKDQKVKYKECDIASEKEIDYDCSSGSNQFTSSKDSQDTRNLDASSLSSDSASGTYAASDGESSDEHVSDKSVQFDSKSEVNKQAKKLETLTFKNLKAKVYSEDEKALFDDDYWIRSVSFETPFMPNCDYSNITYKTSKGQSDFVIYGEAIKPWNQSMIGMYTESSSFSDKEVLSLFPDIRLYTRGNEVYNKVDGFEFDEDLGVIIRISGYTDDQLRQNIVEFPHIFQFDRWVKWHGDEVTIPFWRHIELEGKMVKTTSVWGTDELPDTIGLPKTPIFMNEYVMRKYILEELDGVQHRYKMRGTLKPFLTLYAPPSYYKAKGYDPLEVGRKCIEARKALCYTRNPIINMHETRLVDSAL